MLIEMLLFLALGATMASAGVSLRTHPLQCFAVIAIAIALRILPH